MRPGHLVSLTRLSELRGLAAQDGQWRLGACLSVREICASESVRSQFQALHQGGARLGSPLIRNRATLGGNLVTARPAADLPPPLLAYGARAELRSRSGERTVALADFFQGPGETAKRPDELLTAVVLPTPPPHSGAGYLKLGARRTLVIALVNVAAFLSLDGPEGAIQSARVVLGAVAPMPLCSPGAEKRMLGERPSAALFAAAGEAAAGDCRPIDDFRASAEYRRAMVAVLTRRALGMAWERARANPGSVDPGAEARSR